MWCNHLSRPLLQLPLLARQHHPDQPHAAGRSRLVGEPRRSSLQLGGDVKPVCRWAAGDGRGCVEQMGDSVDELRQSMGQLSGGDVGLKMNDIQTWVSAAITNEDTCMDGFDGMPGTARNAVRAKILNVAQPLALINKLAATIHATNPE